MFRWALHGKRGAKAIDNNWIQRDAEETILHLVASRQFSTLRAMTMQKHTWGTVDGLAIVYSIILIRSFHKANALPLFSVNSRQSLVLPSSLANVSATSGYFRKDPQSPKMG